MNRWRHSRGRVGVVTGLVLALGLTACGGSGDDDNNNNGGSSGEPIELTFWSWVPGIDKAVDLWNSENPDIQVKLDDKTVGSQGGYAKMHAAVEAGTAPDLAQVEYQNIPEFLLDDELVDLSEYGADDVADKFVDWQWQQVSYVDGVYAIPQASGPMGLFYRDDLFTKWGIEVPATWPEFMEAAREVREHGAYIATFPPGNSAWFTALAWQNGANWFGIDGDTWTVDINSPETLEVAEFWDQMVAEDLIKTEADFSEEWNKDLNTGEIVSWPTAQWGDGILAAAAPDTAGKWAAAPIPQWDPSDFKSANWGGSSTAVLKGTEHAEAAMEFAVWLNSDPESIDLLIEGAYGWPAAEDALAGSALDKPYPFFGGQKINDVFVEADAAIDVDWGWIPTVSETYAHLNDGFQQAVDGEGSFVETVEEAQQQTIEDLEARDLNASG
jgi:multiple sugar transport system substrate-binding protein